MKKKIISLLLIVALCLSLETVAFAEESVTEEEKLVQSILEDYDNGRATAEFRSFDYRELTDEELAADPALAQFASELRNIEEQSSAVTRATYPEVKILGKQYSYYITNLDQQTVKYFLSPYMIWAYSDAPKHSPGIWTTSLKVYQSVYIDSEKQDEDLFMSKIELRNITGSFGMGEGGAIIGDVTVSDNIRHTTVDVNILGVLSYMLSAFSPETSDLLGILSSFNFDSNDAVDYDEYAAEYTNTIGLNFKDLTLAYDEEFIGFTANIVTHDAISSSPYMIDAAVLWKFDVYVNGQYEEDVEMDSEKEIYCNL